jgi:hypothetical protein
VFWEKLASVPIDCVAKGPVGEKVLLADDALAHGARLGAALLVEPCGNGGLGERVATRHHHGLLLGEIFSVPNKVKQVKPEKRRERAITARVMGSRISSGSE